MTYSNEEPSCNVQNEFSHEVGGVSPVISKIAMKKFRRLGYPRGRKLGFNSGFDSTLTSAFRVDVFDLPLYVLCFRRRLPNGMPVLISRGTCPGSDYIQNELSAGKGETLFVDTDVNEEESSQVFLVAAFPRSVSFEVVD